MPRAIPFRFLDELPKRTQSELERNFSYITNEMDNLPLANSSIFNAVIDPATPVASPSTHTYPTMTSLLANETWSTTQVFVVGFIQRPGTSVVETSNMTFPGPVVVMSAQHMGQNSTKIFSSTGHSPWDLNGKTFINSNGWVNLVGLYVTSTNTGANVAMSNGNVAIYDCVINCFSGATRTISNVAGLSAAFFSRDSMLMGAKLDNPVTMVLLNTFWFHPIAEAYTITADTQWDGGGLLLAGGNSTLSIAGATNKYFRWTHDMTVGDSLGSGTCTITISATSATFLDIQKMLNTVVLIVNAGAGDCKIRGDAYANVTVSGNSNTKERDFDITVNPAAGTAIDFTGPGHLRSEVQARSVILRGSFVRADLFFLATTAINPYIQCIGLLDSLVTAEMRSPGVGLQAYTLDATSNRNWLILGGVANVVNFSVVSTDAGAGNRKSDSSAVN